MAEYNFREIEKKWQKQWEDKKAYQAEVDPSKPKYYVLDMFPYPSGAGLHVGHPLGYIASDIVTRYKRLVGYNVLHPMGFDSFGLPAEQYAIQTGQHPAITTEQNISRYIDQLKNIGFAYDWSKEVRTSDPSYYKWTQWIFMQLFKSWYNKDNNKAEPIDSLVGLFSQSGNTNVKAVCDEDTLLFSAEEWNSYSEHRQQEILLKYRLAYLATTTVNWCPNLGTVLANEEVKDGVSERGGYPVIKKEMQQWSMRITAYAERFLQGLDQIDWPEPLKEMQRNWIGKSTGAEVLFPIVRDAKKNSGGSGGDAPCWMDDAGGQFNAYAFKPEEGNYLKVFTTRPDTIFGVTFMVIAPEHELTEQLTTLEQRATVEAYVETARNRSERDRMSDVKTVTGVFTGSYAINTISGTKIPIWIADYVLAGYGTGAVMAVPSSDTRDYSFATHFNLPIIPVQEGAGSDITKEDFDPKKGTMINSGFLNGLEVKDAMPVAIAEIEALGLGKGKVNYRMRDAIFSRQRYWGEPVPVYFKDGLPYLIDESELPLVLPEVDKYLPTASGEPPLGRAKDWKYKDQYEYELSTMPGWAGSSWYYYRYMDAHNDKAFASHEAIDYWRDVDLYIGGSEHATGHLLYSRFWNKFLYDLGLVREEEPFKKLINQGMIQGVSEKILRVINRITTINNQIADSNEEVEELEIYLNNERKVGKLPKKTRNIFVSTDAMHFFKGFDANYGSEFNRLFSDFHVDISLVDNSKLDIGKYVEWRPEFKDAVFVCEGGFWQEGNFFSFDFGSSKDFKTSSEVEKMSKSKFNVVNPDDVVEKYGADTLRLYEMFLGPLEQSKPWNTNGISGVHNFLRKLWRLFHDNNGNFKVSDAEPTKDELKALHKAIKKVQEDIDRFSFNTSVSTFMICVNELSALKCNKRVILQDLLVILSPYAPHISEELWYLLGNTSSIVHASYPAYNSSYLVEDTVEYPISINGKMRAKMAFSVDATTDEVEKAVLASEHVQKWLEGKAPKKVIVVPKKIVNIVI